MSDYRFSTPPTRLDGRLGSLSRHEFYQRAIFLTQEYTPT
jgi:hypothetical protein